MAEGWPKKRRLLGTKVKRIDGPDKATGRAKYSYDINRKGMLHGIMLRCPHAHAKIKSFDASAARQTPGFKALVVLGVSKTGTVSEVDAGTGKLVLKPLPVGKKKEKEAPPVTVQVTESTTLLKGNKPAKLADVKVGDVV